MKYLFFPAVLLTILSCSQKVYTTQVSNNANTEEGSIRIISSGKGSNLPAAYKNAVQNAFYTLLYKGVPESIQATPMITDEAYAKSHYSSVLSCFENEDCYKQFLTHAAKEGSKEKIRGDKLFNYQVVSDVTINIRALRAYLEQNNVIRKFGF